ncbi:MAG: glycerol-3-phosphate 1-O-acyltransferase PlsY [Acidiferrobacteraceae bacterium]
MLKALLPVAAYLVGSVSSAVVVSRAMMLPDPRHSGSGNPGATNVLRLGGRKAAGWTLAGDIAKGALPVIVARAAGLSAPWLAATVLLAFLGHLFPVFFGFKGGKGVATAFGALTALDARLGLLLALTWITVAVISRYSSLSAIVSAVAAPVYAWRLLPARAGVAAVAAMAVMLLWRHRRNMANLYAGREGRIGH